MRVSKQFRGFPKVYGEGGKINPISPSSMQPCHYNKKMKDIWEFGDWLMSLGLCL